MDALTRILNTLKLSSTFYYRTELTAPWGMTVPAQDNVARFHIVTRGQCYLRLEGEDEGVFLSNGDLVVIPYGASHSLTDSATTPAKMINEVLDEVSYPGEGPLVYGGDGAACCLVCGEFGFDELGTHPLLDHLPKLLYVSGGSSHNTQWLESALSFISHEALSNAPGSHAIINRLSEVMLIQVIRATIASSNERLPFLSAFADPRIDKVMSAIHANPVEDWTVEKLGRLAAMSRSSFSNLFTALVEMTPMKYIIFVRLQIASRLLIETTISISRIAEQVSYQSEAAFSQAFKKQYDHRPGEFRRVYGQRKNLGEH